ncbi:MAG: AAA family ATPase [Akkermansiaceae bacterium]|jgi:predicted ATPase|nr:AAA family ATPase [Akkermansiaceae bacterium]
MIKRFYVHNFRSLQNFELPVNGDPSALLIGRNGAGKSSVGMAFEILQNIGRGKNRVEKLIKPEEITDGARDSAVRFELEVCIKDMHFAYTLAFELPVGFRELRVLEEKLVVDGNPEFTRKLADVQFSRGGGIGGFDWHLVWLSVAQARTDRDPLDMFRKWLARMLIVRPYPLGISGDSSEETLHPDPEMTNLGDWWSGVIAHAPAAYSRIDQALRPLMPDFLDIKNPLIAKDSRSLEVHFEIATVPFRLLSDGEKCMVIWALVMAANEAYGPLFCFWDEPDNYLAISEIGDFATDLRKAFKSGGQFIATSHNAETIKSFSAENTYILFRRNHHEPTQVRALSELDYGKDLIGALVRGEVEP